MQHSYTPAADLDTTPYWLDSTPAPRFPKFEGNLVVDVVVIGGGMTGITTAYLLKASGLRVALFDRGRCVHADTGHTSAHLTCVTDMRLKDLIDTFGEDHARAVWDGGLAAISTIDSLVRNESIACDFAWVPGYLHAPLDAAGPDGGDALRAEAELAARLGFDATFVDEVPLMQRPGIEFQGQARIHPRKYLAALLKRIDGDGSYVFEHSNVEEIDDEPLTVRCDGHSASCAWVVVATHNPIVGKASLLNASLLQTKLALYSSYVIGARVPVGSVPDALFWDTADPYRFLRLQRNRDYDYVVFGGEDHKTGQELDTHVRYARLEQALFRLVPQAQIAHRWSGQVIQTNDGLPYIGEMAPHQFVATGFNGNGITFGTLSAMMACDLLTGRPNPWRELFDVGRTKIRGGLWDYIKENRDYPYYMLRDRFAGPEGRSLRSVPRGHGKILELNGERVAAYRDRDGRVTLRSPVCTHLGCLVNWNPAERTWDCPCHGSRFTPDGQVLGGPAESPLPEVTVPHASATRAAASGRAE